MESTHMKKKFYCPPADVLMPMRMFWPPGRYVTLRDLDMVAAISLAACTAVGG